MTVGIERLRVRPLGLHLTLTQILPSLLLAGYGVFVLSLFARHALTLYINPSYVWPTVAAGVVLISFGVIQVARHFQGTSHHACCEGEACGCGDAKLRPWSIAALCVPLLLGLIFPPRGLSTFSALQRGPQVAGMSAIPGTAVKHVSLLVDTRSYRLTDWAGALSSDPNPKDYLGKPVDVSGVVLRNAASAPPGYFMVVRYLVWCCIADARPVGLIVRDTSRGAIKDGAWVKVIGKIGETSYQQQEAAVVEPKQILKVKAGNPYTY